MEEPSPYEQIGGDDAVRRLVDRFYDHMDTVPEARLIRAMHPDDLKGSREKLYWFLSGWLGGPRLYWEKRGHPRLRRRHFPFEIDHDAADAWMKCMRLALKDVVEDGQVRLYLEQAFDRVARHMVNQS